MPRSIQNVPALFRVATDLGQPAFVKEPQKKHLSYQQEESWVKSAENQTGQQNPHTIRNRKPFMLCADSTVCRLLQGG